MKVIILYFAKIRELVGIEQETLDVVGTLEDVLKDLATRYESLREIIINLIQNQSEVALAVNAEMTSDFSYIVQEGDEIVFIPPISGG